MVQDGGSRHAAMVSRTRKPSVGGALAYLLLSLFSGLLWWLISLALTLVGLVLSAIWIGLPVLLFATMSWRGAARMERGWMRKMLRTDIVTPYRPPPPGGALRPWRGKLTDPPA